MTPETQPKPRFSSNLQVAPAEAAPSAEVEAGWGSLWQRMVDEDGETVMRRKKSPRVEVGKYPIIYRVFIHVGWLFGISDTINSIS